MRLTQALIAGALLAAPAATYAARPEQQNLTLDVQQRNNNANTSQQTRNFTGQWLQPGQQGTQAGEGRTITSRPAGQELKRSSITGRILASDDHQVLLQDGVGAEEFDVRQLAFTRSLHTGELVTIQMKDDGQSPKSIYLVNASSTMGPVAAEPTP